jgi:hypothetical protein
VNRTVWMFLTLVAATFWYWEVRVNQALRTQVRLRSRITVLTTSHCVQTHHTNKMCLDTLNQVRNLLEYRGTQGHEPGLQILLADTLPPATKATGMGGGE